MSNARGSTPCRQADPHPLPRAQLLHLPPVERVLTQLRALELECRETDFGGYSSQCPYHRSGEGRLNFDVTVVGDQTRSWRGHTLPDGAVLLHCQAYGDLPEPDGCTQDRVIAALGLLPCDLFPGWNSGQDGRPPGSRRQTLRDLEPKPPLSREDIRRWTHLAAQFEAALPEEILVRFHLGWRADDRRRVGDEVVSGACWTIPERDGRGRITGINRRYEDGKKRVMASGRRGLYLPDGYNAMTGPILVPEGVSDAAALVAAGVDAIGRPDVGGGVEELAELLADDRRDVVIVGERDAKPDGRWPGRDGAVATARRLTGLLDRPVRVLLPPEGCKDMRVFINSRRGVSDVD